MDPVTQGVLGAGLAQAFAGPEKVRMATLIGAVAGMAADVDVFIRSTKDPLLHLDFHRQFTHSLFFVPLGALLVAGLFWPLLKRKKLSFKQLYEFSFLGYLTHAPLDSCTSYGTRLLWPLDHTRFAWNNVSVIDPLFTVPLLLLILLCWWRRRPRVAILGLGFGMLYLLFGLFQNHRARIVLSELATQRGHQPMRLQAKPTLANLLLFRGIYFHDERYYVDAVWVGLSGKTRIYSGTSLSAFQASQSYPQLDRDSLLWKDIQRFKVFSDDYLVVHPTKPGMVGDLRYAMLPNDMKPLWGIGINPSQPSSHVSFHNWREMDEHSAPTLKAMILGRDIPPRE